MDITSPSEISRISKKFGFTFKKGLGQNFLTDLSVLEQIAEAADPKDGVLEIGPGFGALTRELAKTSEKVIAIEVDERLRSVLEYTLAGFDNVEVITADIMKADVGKLIKEKFGERKISIAANLPYYITTPIITRLLEARLNVKSIVVMVQKEVALRLAAKSGTKDYGAITILCRYFCEPQIILTVPASSFVPRPKVDSAVLKLKMREEPAIRVTDEELFFKTVKAAFSQRRKTLLNCLSSSFPIPKPQIENIMQSAGIDPKRRGETLDIEEFASLSDALSQCKILG